MMPLVTKQRRARRCAAPHTCIHLHCLYITISCCLQKLGFIRNKMESLLQKLDRAGLEVLCQRLTAKKPRGGNGVEGRYKRLILEWLELYEV